MGLFSEYQFWWLSMLCPPALVFILFFLVTALRIPLDDTSPAVSPYWRGCSLCTSCGTQTWANSLGWASETTESCCIVTRSEMVPGAWPQPVGTVRRTCLSTGTTGLVACELEARDGHLAEASWAPESGAREEMDPVWAFGPTCTCLCRGFQHAPSQLLEPIHSLFLIFFFWLKLVLVGILYFTMKSLLWSRQKLWW